MLGPYFASKLGVGEDAMLARVASPRGGDVKVRVMPGGRTVLGGKAITTLLGHLVHVEEDGE